MFLIIGRNLQQLLQYMFLCVSYAGHGITTDNHTIFINCAVCDMEYSPVQKPIIFDFPTPSPQKETTV